MSEISNSEHGKPTNNADDFAEKARWSEAERIAEYLEAAATRYHEAGYGERAIACSVMATEIKTGAHHA